MNLIPLLLEKECYGSAIHTTRESYQYFFHIFLRISVIR